MNKRKHRNSSCARQALPSVSSPSDRRRLRRRRRCQQIKVKWRGNGKGSGKAEITVKDHYTGRNDFWEKSMEAFCGRCIDSFYEIRGSIKQSDGPVSYAYEVLYKYFVPKATILLCCIVIFFWEKFMVRRSDCHCLVRNLTSENLGTEPCRIIPTEQYRPRSEASRAIFAIHIVGE